MARRDYEENVNPEHPEPTKKKAETPYDGLSVDELIEVIKTKNQRINALEIESKGKDEKISELNEDVKKAKELSDKNSELDSKLEDTKQMYERMVKNLSENFSKDLADALNKQNSQLKEVFEADKAKALKNQEAQLKTEFEKEIENLRIYNAEGIDSEELRKKFVLESKTELKRMKKAILREASDSVKALDNLYDRLWEEAEAKIAIDLARTTRIEKLKASIVDADEESRKAEQRKQEAELELKNLEEEAQF